MSADTPVHNNYGPIEMLENNIKAYRDHANAHRADAERSAKKAVDEDNKADTWQLALDKLKS